MRITYKVKPSSVAGIRYSIKFCFVFNCISWEDSGIICQKHQPRRKHIL